MIIMISNGYSQWVFIAVPAKPTQMTGLLIAFNQVNILDQWAIFPPSITWLAYYTFPCTELKLKCFVSEINLFFCFVFCLELEIRKINVEILVHWLITDRLIKNGKKFHSFLYLGKPCILNTIPSLYLVSLH